MKQKKVKKIRLDGMKMSSGFKLKSGIILRKMGKAFKAKKGRTIDYGM